MLTKRLLALQTALSPWDAAARLTTVCRNDQPRRGAKSQPPRGVKSWRGPPDAPNASADTSSGSTDASNGSSLYNRLFPDPAPTIRKRPTPKRENVPAREPPATLLRSALIRDMKAWGWEDNAQSKIESRDTKPPRWGERYIRGKEGDEKNRESQSYNGPAILELNSASKSLLESDFYRLGRQGQHLHGWASGIVKVVQSRSPTTQEPLGRYFIHFDTRAAAMAYLDEVMRLLLLSRKAAGDNWHLSPRDPTGPMPLAPKLGAEPGGEGDTDANLRAFTLVPPSAVLNLKLRLPADQNEQAAVGRTGLGKASDIGGGIWAGAHDADRKGDHHKVLVWLDGTHLTKEELLEAIDDDGRDRNLDWRFQDGTRSVSPVTFAESRRSPEEGSENGRSRFGRFILSFAEPVEARRFARSWHKRPLSLVDRDREAVVNATALW